MKGVKTVFAHDTHVALHTAAALVNTKGRDADALGDVAALETFVRDQGLTWRVRRDRQELAQVRALRPRLRRFWELDQDGVVALVNRMLRQAHALPQLVRHDEWDYHMHATPSHAPLADRMAVEAAMAIVDVVRQQALDRLSVCDADDCADVFIDISKNHSRRYCSTACSNRVNVAAFRTRRR